jgi:hypothetical protein
VDFTNGNPVPIGGISFDGGAGSSGNLLVVDGSGNADTATLSSNSIVFDGAAAITYANTQSLTLNTAAGNDTITQIAQPAVPNVVFNGGTGNDTLNINAGAFSFSSDAGAGTSSLTVNATGGGSSVSFTGGQHLSALNLTSSAAAIMTAAALDLSPSMMHVNTLSFDSSNTKLDLVNNELLTGNSLTSVRSLISQGHLWTSIGSRVVGSLDIGGGQVEARPTLAGDTNLDGAVDVADLGNLATNFGFSTGGVWGQGDFDYNGSVDVADLGDLATNFGLSIGGGSGSAASPAAMATSVVSSATSANVARGNAAPSISQAFAQGVQSINAVDSISDHPTDDVSETYPWLVGARPHPRRVYTRSRR